MSCSTVKGSASAVQCRAEQSSVIDAPQATTTGWILLPCTALHCTALSCTALNCTLLHCSAINCAVTYYAIPYCTTP